MNASTRFWLRTVVASGLGGASLLGGCSAPPENAGRFAIESGRYSQAVDVSREVLVDEGFEIDRVDAAGGVVTSLPKRTAGVATPWDGEQTTLQQEWEDFINRQSREVRVVFEPADGGDATAGDLRDADAAGVGVAGYVEVVVLRQNRAHRRLDSDVIWLSSYAGDPLMARRHGTRYEVARQRDGLLERRIAEAIQERLGGAGLSSPETSNSEMQGAGR